MIRYECDGEVSTGEFGELLCSGEWLPVAEPSYLDVDPAIAGSAFMIGFVLVGSFALLGAGVRAVLRVVR